jgi:segregation and condensation protein B
VTIPSEAARAVEAILMVAQEPVDPHLLAQLLELAPARVDELCTGLAEAYEAEGRGWQLVKVAGGYRFQSHPDLTAYVERFALEGQSARLSSAALETLAIVAYKQPLSRAQVAAIRGVNVDGVMRTLQQRGYIAEVGRDSGPGQAALFGTTSEFLERLGLDRIEDLPPIAELFPSADVMEALEKTLRAEPAQPVVEEAPEAPAGEAAEAPTETPAAPAQPVVAPTFADAFDERPEPEPPAWAVDAPEPHADDGDDAADAEPGQGEAATGSEVVDLDGDGETDLHPEP